ncbi:hypothetical protein V2J09_017512 [Rumex salicifolius]
MDKELVELYEAAKRAGDAAALEDDGSAEESRCLDALKELKGFPVNYKILVDTQVGKRLRHLTKHPRKKIQAYAADLIEIWKNIIIEETNRNKKSGNSDNKPCTNGDDKKRPISVKTEKFSQPDIVRKEKVEQEFSPRPAKMVKSESFDKKMDNCHSVKIESGSSVHPVKANTSLKMENQASDSKRPLSVSSGPPKLTSMIKCNDDARDNVRKILHEALCKVSGEADVSIRDDVEACDPIRVAVTVESVMFEKWGRSTGAQKVKYRSVIFNLKDQKNPDFRRRVLLGHVRAEDIPTLTPEDMASDQRKLENKQIKDKALFECERGIEPKATTDQFKCGRCKQRKCTYYQMQTRSADEPMTTYVTCVNCNNHWKFC